VGARAESDVWALSNRKSGNTLVLQDLNNFEEKEFYTMYPGIHKPAQINGNKVIEHVVVPATEIG